MRIVLLKDLPLGRRGDVVEVADTRAAELIRKGHARRHSFRDEVVTK